MNRAVDAVAVDSPYASLPLGLYLAAASGVMLGALSPNPALTVAAIVSLIAFIKLLWRPGEPPVLLFAVGFQWLQVTAKVFHANYLGLPLEHISQFASIENAVWASLAGLWVLTGGIRLVLARMPSFEKRAVRSQAYDMSLMKIGLLYIGLTVLTSGISTFASGMGGLRQIILAAAAVKWVAYFLFAYVILVRREHVWILGLATTWEIVQGIGFFSGFKTVLFILIIVIVTARVRATRMRIGGIAAIGIVLLIMGLAWTAVKGEYRAFLNQGTGWQTVTVSNEEKVTMLADMLLSLNPSDLVEAADPLFSRIAYVDFFAAAMDYVPAARPHERGALWTASVTHVLQPRLFYPNKPALPSDSELTMAYTGLHMASGDQGTSISLGYMGESYVDFGIPGMYFPIFALGFFWAFVYRHFLKNPRLMLLGYGFATAALLEMYKFEMASIKVLGNVLMQFIVLGLIFHFIVPRIAGWLMQENNRTRAAPRHVVVRGNVASTV